MVEQCSRVSLLILLWCPPLVFRKALKQFLSMLGKLSEGSGCSRLTKESGSLLGGGRRDLNEIPKGTEPELSGPESLLTWRSVFTPKAQGSGSVLSRGATFSHLCPVWIPSPSRCSGLCSKEEG